LEKLSKKKTELVETKLELKLEKSYAQRVDKEKKQVENSYDDVKDKTKGLDDKLKKMEDSRDSWKKKADQLANEVSEMKKSTSSKPSSTEQLILEKKKMEIKLDFDMKRELHKQGMKQQEEERKLKSKSQRFSGLSLFTGGGNSNGQWPIY